MFALLPMALTVVFAYLGTMIWTARVSAQQLAHVSIRRLRGPHAIREAFQQRPLVVVAAKHRDLRRVLYCRVHGDRLAARDLYRSTRGREAAHCRTVFLYPYAMSFVATGLVWQWILNPQLGAQAVLHKLGFVHARFDWIAHQTGRIYTIASLPPCGRLPDS